MYTTDDVSGGGGRGRRRRSFSHLLWAAYLLWDDLADAAVAWLRADVASGDKACPRILTARGPNRDALLLAATMLSEVPPGTRAHQVGRCMVLALWAQDNPRDFVRPAWCPALDLPGDVAL